MEAKDIVNSLQKAIETNGVDVTINGLIDKQGKFTMTNISIIKKSENKERKIGF